MARKGTTTTKPTKPTATIAAQTAKSPAEKPTSAPAPALTIPQPPSVALGADSGHGDVKPLFKYRRRAGFRPYLNIKGKVYKPGDILETPFPNTIPASFMDGWELIESPSFENLVPVKLPTLFLVEGGFDVITDDGRKLNDHPLNVKQAQELIDGLNPKIVE